MSNNDVGDKVRDIQVRIEAAQRARVRAEQDRDRAFADIKEVKETLERDFQVYSVEEGERLLSSLEHDVKLELEDIEEKLRKLGV